MNSTFDSNDSKPLQSIEKPNVPDKDDSNEIIYNHPNPQTVHGVVPSVQKLPTLEVITID
jgi:hypothetical protein